MNFKDICINKSLVSGKYLIGIDPGDTDHRAIILSPNGIPVIKSFGFKVNKRGFEKFKSVVNKVLPSIPNEDIIIGMETSCNLWQTFVDYFKDDYTIVKISPLTTYLSRGKKRSNFSKTDGKDAFLISEAVEQGNFLQMQNKTDPVYKQLRDFNIYFNKISNNLTQSKLRLRAYVKMIFPEFLKCLRLDSLTALYLLKNYMTPKEFIELDIEKEVPVIKKLSVSQHGEKTLLKIKELAAESIGVKVTLNYDSLRTSLSSMIRSYQHYIEETAIIGEQLISLSKTVSYFDIIISLKGISEISAAQLVAELGDVYRFNHYKQVENYAGFNLRVNQSGKVSGARHINKIGNKRLGKIIYQCIRHTSRFIPEIRMKYLRRKQKRNIYKKNIVACVPQFLSLLMSLIKNNKPYKLDENKYYELCKLEQKYKLNSKELTWYEPREKSRYHRPDKAKKININNL